MKSKFLFSALCASLLIGSVFYACSKKEETTTTATKPKETNSTHRELDHVVKVRLAIRWPGIDLDHDGKTCDCPGCKIPTCPCPLGICIDFGCRLGSEPLNETEQALAADGDLGVAYLSIVNGKVRFDLDQETCIQEPTLSNGDKIIYMYQGWALPSNVAAALGYSGITIQNGIYHPDFTENPFGIVDVNATLVQ